MTMSTTTLNRTYPAPAATKANRALHVTVVATSTESTLSALRTAGALAKDLHASIKLVVPQVVPYPLPLNQPPVPLDFSSRHFRVLAGKTPVETTVQIYLCRDREQILQSVLPPRSLVVIGGRRSWWPTPEKRLARRLRRRGHEVVLTEA